MKLWYLTLQERTRRNRKSYGNEICLKAISIGPDQLWDDALHSVLHTNVTSLHLAWAKLPQRVNTTFGTGRDRTTIYDGYELSSTGSGVVGKVTLPKDRRCRFVEGSESRLVLGRGKCRDG